MVLISSCGAFPYWIVFRQHKHKHKHISHKVIFFSGVTHQYLIMKLKSIVNWLNISHVWRKVSELHHIWWAQRTVAVSNIHSRYYILLQNILVIIHTSPIISLPSLSAPSSPLPGFNYHYTVRSFCKSVSRLIPPGCKAQNIKPHHFLPLLRQIKR